MLYLVEYYNLVATYELYWFIDEGRSFSIQVNQDAIWLDWEMLLILMWFQIIATE